MDFKSVSSYPLRPQLDQLPLPAWKPLPQGQVRQLHVRYGRGPVHAKKGALIKDPRDIWLIFNDLAYLPVEVFRVAFLDSGNRLMAYEDIARGTLNRISNLHPREVFFSAVHLRAFALIGMHNHPGGSLKPSPEDIEQTRVLRQVGELLGIELLDNVILTPSGYYSFFLHGEDGERETPA